MAWTKSSAVRPSTRLRSYPTVIWYRRPSKNVKRTRFTASDSAAPDAWLLLWVPIEFLDQLRTLVDQAGRGRCEPRLLRDGRERHAELKLPVSGEVLGLDQDADTARQTTGKAKVRRLNISVSLLNITTDQGSRPRGRGDRRVDVLEFPPHGVPQSALFGRQVMVHVGDRRGFGPEVRLPSPPLRRATVSADPASPV